MTTFTLQQLINDSVRADRKPHTPQHWSPSALGSCLCGVYLARTGAKRDEEFDDRTLRVFHIGNMFEDWAVELVKKQHPTLETQVEVWWKEYDFHGFADAVVREEPMVYEFKSKNSRAFWYMDKKKEGANAQHKMQTWSYLKCLNIPEGRILYLEKDTLSTLEFPVYLNDEVLGQSVENELKLLNKAWENKTPPKPATEGWQATYCGFHKQCESVLASGNYIT